MEKTTDQWVWKNTSAGLNVNAVTIKQFKGMVWVQLDYNEQFHD